jgi:hypothetical protein
MPIHGRLVEAAACCLTTLQRYQEGDRNEAAKARMNAEIGLTVAYLLDLELPQEVVAAEVLKPVMSVLIDRYGMQGHRLTVEFCDAFVQGGMSIPTRWSETGHEALPLSHIDFGQEEYFSLLD